MADVVLVRGLMGSLLTSSLSPSGRPPSLEVDIDGSVAWEVARVSTSCSGLGCCSCAYPCPPRSAPSCLLLSQWCFRAACGRLGMLSPSRPSWISLLVYWLRARGESAHMLGTSAFWTLALGEG